MYSSQSSRESLSSLLQMDGADTSCWCSNITPSSSEKMRSPHNRGRSNSLTQKGHFLVLSQLIHHHTFDICSQKSGFANSPKPWLERAARVLPMMADAISMTWDVQIWHQQRATSWPNAEEAPPWPQRGVWSSPTLLICISSSQTNPFLCFKNVREGQLTTITPEFQKLAKQYSFKIPQAYPQLLPQVACYSTPQNAIKNMFLVKTFHNI